MCDGSNFHIGAILGQKEGKASQVIYYASKTLDNSQVNYSTTEKELLAIVFALEKFRQYLLGTKVIIYSDHVALNYLMTKKDAKPQLIRAEKLVADHLSRLNIRGSSSSILDEFSEEHLFYISNTIPRFADIVNYLVTKEIPHAFTKYQKATLKSDSKYYVREEAEFHHALWYTLFSSSRAHFSIVLT
uniref:Reverse transcriptase RNase H-like domain-containing protein n=1 Tax=Lactuca sativa TaxID=4236 RepID=A0A9R1VWT9_LACSA|nr:hypothetical protein LSAT_V11C400166890 [Lactuca sativa]